MTNRSSGSGVPVLHPPNVEEASLSTTTSKAEGLGSLSRMKKENGGSKFSAERGFHQHAVGLPFVAARLKKRKKRSSNNFDRYHTTDWPPQPSESGAYLRVFLAPRFEELITGDFFFPLSQLSPCMHRSCSQILRIRTAIDIPRLGHRSSLDVGGCPPYLSCVISRRCRCEKIDTNASHPFFSFSWWDFLP